MNVAQQFAKYAQFYNLLYNDKNYRKEANYISNLIKKFSSEKFPQKKILDLACGTGRHAFFLEESGYSVEGSDISAEMVTIARNTAKTLGKKIEFHNHSFQESNKIAGKFDVVISMFSAIDYLTDYEDLRTTLGNVHNLLAEEGILIFDYWNGNAVVRDYSPFKVLKKQSSGEKIVRISETNLDLFNQLANVKFSCMYFDKNSKMQEFEETHTLRYFYFDEIKTFLKLNGFEIVYRGPFMKLDENLDPFEWNISIVAEKLKG